MSRDRARDSANRRWRARQSAADRRLIVEALQIAEADLRTRGTEPAIIDTSAGDALLDKADAMEELRQALLFD